MVPLQIDGARNVILLLIARWRISRMSTERSIKCGCQEVCVSFDVLEVQGRQFRLRVVVYINPRVADMILPFFRYIH